MKLRKIVVLSALIATSSYVFAGGFDGPFAQVGVTVAKSETKISGTGTILDGSESENSTVGNLSAGYSKSFGAFNLAGSAYYLIGTLDAGKRTFTAGGDSATIKAKGTNTWGLNIAPGWNVTQEMLVYVTLGYSSTKGKAELDYNIGGTVGSERESTNYTGYSYGLGAKYKFTSNLYGVAEVAQVNYNRKDGIEPSSTSGTIGIGFKF